MGDRRRAARTKGDDGGAKRDDEGEVTVRCAAGLRPFDAIFFKVVS